MNALRRAAVVLLAGLLCALFGPALAPSQQAKPAPGAVAGILELIADRKTAAKLEAAADYIAEEDWKSAVTLLQNVLDRKEDILVRLKAPGAKEPRPDWYASAYTEAERQLASLPPAGRDFYQVAYGRQAAALLQQARQNRDAELMTRIAQRFLYTDAGPAALRSLAHLHYRADHFDLAALAYIRLLDHVGPARWPTEDLYEATATFRRVGDRAHADLTLKHLLARAGRNVLRVGKQSLSAEDMRKELDRLAPLPARSDDWPLYGGNAQRSGQAAGGVPFLVPRFKTNMLRDDKGTAAHHLRTAEKWFTDNHQPLLVAFSPIAVTTTRKEEKLPLLLYKDYWGIGAINVKTGKLEWDSPSSWSLERMLGPRADAKKQQAVTQWLQFYQQQAVRPQILFENSTVSSLSTDGKFVYVVEDLTIPPPPNVGWNPGIQGANGYGPEIQDAITHSRLQAFNLVVGKLIWEAGEKGSLGDCYFLGAPLPLDGKLYLLTEKRQELRVVCLETVGEPARRLSVRVVWEQALAHVGHGLTEDPVRRTQAVHIASSGGILVCPSNAGAVFGVDLLSHRLAWAYPYREKGDAAPMQANRFRQPGLPPGWVIGPGGRPMPAAQVAPLLGGWKVTAPTIQDGKVVFTPPDAPSLHCINLSDGSPNWSRKKLEDDLYLGGVYNGKVLIVGKKSVRALNLANGETLWTLETGLPSGQGIASNNVYYLPLKEAGRNREPEICAIDVNKGQIVARARSRPKVGVKGLEVPGNLLFFDGDLISQSAWELTVYPQLKVKMAQMDELLSKNPNDPAGLAERALLRLDKGDLVGAVADLTAALKNKPNADTQARARALLYDTLTELLQRDFNAGEKYLKEYEELSKAESDKTEQRRRRANYFVLLGKGRESQGRLGDALNAYLDLASVGADGDLLAVIGQPGVRVRPDVWARQRIGEMLQKAKPEQRKELEAEIERWLKKAQDQKDVDALRGFVRLFGPESAAGREARLMLAERLIDKCDYLEADLHLQAVRRRREGPVQAARAVEMLARLSMSRREMPDAVYYYRILGRDFARTTLPGGKTGAEVLEALTTDKRFLPYLDEPIPFKGRTQVKSEHGVFPMSPQDGNAAVFQFEHRGEALPFFHRYALALRLDNHQLMLIDRNSAERREQRWHKTINRTMFANLAGHTTVRFPYHSLGHLIVLPVAQMVFGINADTGEIKWERDLSASARRTPVQLRQVIVDSRDDTLQIVYDDWIQRLGQNLVLGPSVLCLSTREGLLGIDPLTGRTLWQRSDVSPRNRIFGDGEYVFVVEEDADGTPRKTRVLHIADGSAVPAPAFADLFGKRVQVLDGRLLLSEEGDGGKVTLRLYDVRSGKDLFRQAYPPKSLVLRSEDSSLTGVVEPDGKVHVIDLRLRKEVLTGKMEAAHLQKVQTIHLLADAAHFYLACYVPVEDVNINLFGGLQSNLLPNSGLRALPVNGMVYAFERTSGEIAWFVSAPNQMIVLDQFRDLPVMLLTSGYQKFENVAFRGNQMRQVVALMAIDKRVGKLLYEDKNLKNVSKFHAIHIDVRAGKIEFIAYNFKLDILLDDARK